MNTVRNLFWSSTWFNLKNNPFKPSFSNLSRSNPSRCDPSFSNPTLSNLSLSSSRNFDYYGTARSKKAALARDREIESTSLWITKLFFYNLKMYSYFQITVFDCVNIFFITRYCMCEILWLTFWFCPLFQYIETFLFPSAHTSDAQETRTKNCINIHIMSVVIETTLGDLTVDLFTKERPKTCLNFVKLCKAKKYNMNLFHMVQPSFIAQTGDPTGTGRGGESIFQELYGNQARWAVVSSVVDPHRSALVWSAGSWSRRAKITHNNRKKLRLHFLKCWMFSSSLSTFVEA